METGAGKTSINCRRHLTTMAPAEKASMTTSYSDPKVSGTIEGCSGSKDLRFLVRRQMEEHLKEVGLDRYDFTMFICCASVVIQRRLVVAMFLKCFVYCT